MVPSDPEPLLKRAYRYLPRGWTAALDLYLTRRHGGERSPARLDVMTCFGGDDLDVLQVLLQSLSETHPRDRIEFWLFYLNIGPRKFAALRRFCQRLPNLTLNPVQVPDSDSFAELSRLGGRPYGARFLWLVAHQHLPAGIERVICLDPLDTLVTGDLLPFLHHPFFGKYLAACRESPSVPPLIMGPARRAHDRGASRTTILRASRSGMNSGAIVLNLGKLRRDGITIAPYLQTARWARHEMGLQFGDQGLFFMTHGSQYTQAHDRYNFRFATAGRWQSRLRPAVVHFAGRVHKPAHLRLTPDQEQRIAAHLARTGQKLLPLNPSQATCPRFFPYYRAWWEVCARTPAFARIAPLAEAYTGDLLARLDVQATADRKALV